MVNHGYPWLTMFKPKSIIIRLRIVRFQCFFDQNDRNFVGILFQTSKGQISFIFDEYWRFFWFLNLRTCFFLQRSTIRKSHGVPTASRPTRGGDHMVPKGTIRYHKVPEGTLWYHMVPHGTIWYHMVPYGTICYTGIPKQVGWERSWCTAKNQCFFCLAIRDPSPMQVSFVCALETIWTNQY